MKVDGVEVTIQSDATKACAELDKMIAKLGQVSNAITSTKSNRLGGKSNLTGTTNRLGSFISMSGKAKKSTMSLASAFGKFYASCFLIIRGVKSLGKAIQSSMNYIETFNYYNVIMDKLGNEFGNAWKENGYSSAEEYANSFSDRLNELTQKMTGFKVGEDGGLSLTSSIGLGMDPNVMMNFETQITSITNSLGLCAETSINTSKALSMLAADMSSLRNIDLEDVMTNLQSGLIGQARALYKYGIDITNATLQTYAYKYGLEKAVAEMTQAEKMQLRLLAILDQSKVAWGDMANTVSTASNQYRIMKQQISNLARMIGNIFLPVVAKILPYINALIISLQHLFTWVGKMLGISTKDLMEGISTGYTDSGLDNLGESADDVTSALDDASKAAKKLKSNVLGIDELNINNPTDTSSASVGGSGSSIDLSSSISDALADYESVWDKALDNMENKAQAIADNIINAFKKGDFTAIGSFIGTSLTGALNEIDWNAVYASTTKFVSGIAGFLNGFITPELFSSVASTIAGTLNTEISAWFTAADAFNWENLGNSIATGINTFFNDFDFVKLGQTLNKWVDGLKFALWKVIVRTDWDEVFKGIKSFLDTLDLDTITVIVGAWALKMASGVLASTAFKTLVLEKLLGGTVSISIPEIVVSLGSFLIKYNPGMLGEIGIQVERLLQGTFMDTSTWKGVPKAINDGIGNAINFAGKLIITNFFNAITTTLQGSMDLFDGASYFFDKIGEDFEKGDWGAIGLDLLNGILGGILTAFSVIASPFTALFNWVYNGICDIFGIHSPAKEMKPLGQYILEGVIKGFTDTVSSFTTAITDWFDNSVKPWFTLTKWTDMMSNIPMAFLNVFSSAIKTALDVLNPFIEFVGSVFDGVDLSFDLGEVTKKAGANINFKAKGFATGGFPDTADLFYANENGVPELVGSVGSRTVVASGTEITGISDAVYNTAEAEMQLLREQNALLRQLLNKNTSVNIGDKEIARANIRGQRSMGLQVRTT